MMKPFSFKTVAIALSVVLVVNSLILWWWLVDAHGANFFMQDGVSVPTLRASVAHIVRALFGTVSYVLPISTLLVVLRAWWRPSLSTPFCHILAWFVLAAVYAGFNKDGGMIGTFVWQSLVARLPVGVVAVFLSCLLALICWQLLVGLSCSALFRHARAVRVSSWRDIELPMPVDKLRQKLYSQNTPKNAPMPDTPAPMPTFVANGDEWQNYVQDLAIEERDFVRARLPYYRAAQDEVRINPHDLSPNNPSDANSHADSSNPSQANLHLNNGFNASQSSTHPSGMHNPTLHTAMDNQQVSDNSINSNIANDRTSDNAPNSERTRIHDTWQQRASAKVAPPIGAVPPATTGLAMPDEHTVADFTSQNNNTDNVSAMPTAQTVSSAIAIKPADIAQSVPSGPSSTDEGKYQTGNQSAIAIQVADSDINAETMPIIDESKSYAMQMAAHTQRLPALPSLSLLNPPVEKKAGYSQEELEELSARLEMKLAEFNIQGKVADAICGPVVTSFHVDLAAGVKASKVTGVAQDLARSMAIDSLRVVETVKGKPYISLEIPNRAKEIVNLSEMVRAEAYQDTSNQLSIIIGKDISGNPVITDLVRTPHMLVAGTTGSGKSVLVNCMLLSLLLKYTPKELRLILIDPKFLEFNSYEDIPHLLTPVINDMNEAVSAFNWCVEEMERRYQLMKLFRVRKIDEFNDKVREANERGEPLFDPTWRANDSVSQTSAPKLAPLPFIAVVADEFSDLMVQAGKAAETPIVRLTQKARAAGIHLILATQRPSVDVITGLIKANIPTRVGLRVGSRIDSRTILDQNGAEDMLGHGDMLFLAPNSNELIRVHGALIENDEVNRICDAWRMRGTPEYIDLEPVNVESSEGSGDNSGGSGGESDPLYDQAVAFVLEQRKVSVSSLQRRFSLGYNRAARIVDAMEATGIVSPMDKSGKRSILAD